MLFNHRIIHGNNGTLVDLSLPLNDLGGDEALLSYVIDDDYLYIGGDVPFTHRFFKLGETVNDETAAISEIAIWDGGTWVPSVDVQDGTSVGGKSFARSGVVSWTTDRNSHWGQEATTENMTGSGLETLKVYDLYWARIKFDATLTADIVLQYVGHRFSDDGALALQYPDLILTATKNAFRALKDDWNDQHILAAQDIVRYLQRHHELWSPNQILNWQRFTGAAVHKCAEIAYSAFSGDDMEVLRARAEKNYKIQLNQGLFEVDKNQDGHVAQRERKPFTGITRQ